MLYTPVNVAVAENQLMKLKSSFKNGGSNKSLSIKIQLKSKKNKMPTEHTLLLTRAQIAKIERVRAIGQRTFTTIRMSRNQIQKNIKHQGGFLSFLAGLASKALPALAKGVATGLLSGAVDGFGKGSGDGLYLFRSGHCIKVDPVKGNGLYLTPHSSGNGKLGDGLYLKRGNTIHNGEGLILGEKSPFKNIPILGWIL